MDSDAWALFLANSGTTANISLNPTEMTPQEVSELGYLPSQTLSATQATVIAQQFDQDILGDMGNAWNTFIESGQVWALVIGLVLGYMIRGLTAY